MLTDKVNSNCTYPVLLQYHHIYTMNIDLLWHLMFINYLFFRYNANVKIGEGNGNTPLNGDHTHFIMVDDGSRYRFFGKSANFITRFEAMVRSPEVSLAFKQNLIRCQCPKSLIYIYRIWVKKYLCSIVQFLLQGLGIPMVTILLEGGKEAIRIVKERLKVGIACIIVEGKYEINWYNSG